MPNCCTRVAEPESSRPVILAAIHRRVPSARASQNRITMDTNNKEWNLLAGVGRFEPSRQQQQQEKPHPSDFAIHPDRDANGEFCAPGSKVESRAATSGARIISRTLLGQDFLKTEVVGIRCAALESYRVIILWEAGGPAF